MVDRRSDQTFPRRPSCCRFAFRPRKIGRHCRFERTAAT
jgi:hypothetical protein